MRLGDLSSLKELWSGSGDTLSGGIMNLVISAGLAMIIGRCYRHFATGPSDRAQFGRTLLPVATSTTLIIMIVKSSLALSLGLVGALSIVRFRAAIKEPEELAYLFLTIAAGLGLGAGQRALTVSCVFAILGMLAIRHVAGANARLPRVHLIVTVPSRGGHDGADLLSLLEKSGDSRDIELVRLDEDGERMEAMFRARFRSTADLEKCRAALRSAFPACAIQFLDADVNSL